MTMKTVTIAAIDAVPAGSARVFEAHGVRVLLTRIDGAIHALQATCPHRGCEWDGATVEGEILSCPRCRFRYSARTGLNPQTTACHVNQSTAEYHYRNFPEGRAELFDVVTIDGAVSVSTEPRPFVKVIV
jgi:nitrite reductase/ring-hydroxylating ferredoxin subunit